MTTYTFIGNPNTQSVAWNDGTVWSSGDPLNPFPNSPTADVVIPEITRSDGSIYTSFITIQNSASYAANSVSLTDNDLIVNGALSVTNGVDVKGGGEINIGGPGATISAGSLTVESAASPANGQIQGNGQIQVVTLTNSGSIVSSGDLAVDAHVLDNIGTLAAGSGTFTVIVDSGGFSNLSGSTLTGGSYVAPGGGCILDLNVGAVITTDAANIQLGGGGDFRSFDNGSSTYVSLQTSLTTIAQDGTLGLTNQTFNSNGLTVNGTLTLSYSSANANLTAPLLTVGNQGTVSGVGTIIAPINNAGIITAGFMPGTVVQPAITPTPRNNLLEITGAVSGTGVLEIGAPYALPNGKTNTFVPATLQLDGADSENVVFNNATHGGGTLLLNDFGDFTGAIAPESAGDNIILPNMSFSSVTGYSYAGNTSGGTLTIHETGNVTISLNFLGDLDTADFTLAAGPQPLSSSPPSLEITVNPFPPPSFPPPNPALPTGTTAVMVMNNPSNGNYEIYDIGNNSVLGAFPLGTIGTPWHAVGFGGFNGGDTADMMLRSSSDGSFEIVDINNNNASGPFQLGAVGLIMTVAGFGDFSGRPGETDMVLRNSNTGEFVVYDVSNNMVTSATSLGAVGLQEQVLGFGDFSGKANETDMLLRDSNTGMVTLYEISNNQVTSATALGAIGSPVQFAGAGDFSGRPGETDMLMRDSRTGNLEVYDFQNGTIASATSLGAVGLQWTVAGFGDLSGNANETDMMMRTDTGAFMIYDISNNQITGVHAIGAVGLSWQVTGIANDPPTSGAPSSGAAITSDQGQSSLAAPAASDPAGAGGWLSQMMQTPQSETTSWLTEVMQAGASPVSGPGFDAGGDPIAGTMPIAPLATPTLLPTHSA